MGDLTCRACRHPVSPGDLICPGCRANLTALDAVVDADAPAGSTDPTALFDPAAEAGTENGPDSDDPVTGSCPRCGGDLPAADTPVCPACLAPLAGALVLRLDAAPEVRWRQVVLPGTDLVLGRDPRHSPAAAVLARYDTVSRQHARVSVDRHRRATVTDLGSTNGTFVDDLPVPPDTAVDLPAGARLRLGRGVALLIEPA